MKKYLVIQQKMVGDVLMSTLLCEHLKTNISNCKVHYMIHEHTQGVVLGNPFIDEIVVFKSAFRKNKWLFAKFLLRLRKNRYDAVIDVYGKLESNLISLIVKSPLKISYKKWYSSFIYDETFERGNHPKTNLGDAIETRLVLLKPIIDELKNPKIVPKIHLSENELEEIKAFLNHKNVDFDKPFLIVGALGSSTEKSYPLPFMAQLLDHISENQNIILIFNALPSQKKQVEALIEMCAQNTQEKIRKDIFITGLREFIGVLSLSNGYFGNEGGAGNMARALGVPNFSIFSPWISKEAWLTDKLNKANVAVHLADFEPKVLSIPKKTRKKKALVYYQQFTPDLIIPRLLDFLKGEVYSNQ